MSEQRNEEKLGKVMCSDLRRGLIMRSLSGFSAETVLTAFLVANNHAPFACLPALARRFPRKYLPRLDEMPVTRLVDVLVVQRGPWQGAFLFF